MWRLQKELENEYVYIPDPRKDSADRTRDWRKMTVASLERPAQIQREILLEEINSRIRDPPQPKFCRAMLVTNKDQDNREIMSKERADECFETYRSLLEETFERGMCGVRQLSNLVQTLSIVQQTQMSSFFGQQ